MDGRHPHGMLFNPEADLLAKARNLEQYRVVHHVAPLRVPEVDQQNSHSSLHHDRRRSISPERSPTPLVRSDRIRLSHTRLPTPLCMPGHRCVTPSSVARESSVDPFLERPPKRGVKRERPDDEDDEEREQWFARSLRRIPSTTVAESFRSNLVDFHPVAVATADTTPRPVLALAPDLTPTSSEERLFDTEEAELPSPGSDEDGGPVALFAGLPPSSPPPGSSRASMTEAIEYTAVEGSPLGTEHSFADSDDWGHPPTEPISPPGSYDYRSLRRERAYVDVEDADVGDTDDQSDAHTVVQNTGSSFFVEHDASGYLAPPLADFALEDQSPTPDTDEGDAPTPRASYLDWPSPVVQYDSTGVSSPRYYLPLSPAYLPPRLRPREGAGFPRRAMSASPSWD
ncbi:hypothetical protein K488DRAFT_82942 [Vararia minispora EC-137]|uniref:Uncharacterized protein n=1 Tax=Vararia minispora EC-137 TaxID=1314806 RepID=A0ACB8QUC5_9AGAM|nr:hypothetical protein K488DRAFT_82942 [Vararia minispora EC-137]